MVKQKRKVGEEIGRELKANAINIDTDEFKTIPQYKWDAAKELIREQYNNPNGKDQTILVLGEDEIQAIASKERLRIIKFLQSNRSSCIQDITNELGRDPAAVSRDISILEKIGIIKKVREGKTVKIIPCADMIILPIIEKDLFQMLAHPVKGKKTGSIEGTVETLEQLLILSIIYEKIFPRLDEKMKGHRKLTLMMSAWMLQEINDLPDRFVKVLQSMPENCWDDEPKAKDCPVPRPAPNPI
jgi:predicted transcriptional regulator